MENGSILDTIGLKLLAELQKNPRASYAELGRQVGLSPSATAERVRRLEDAKIIKGYRLDIDPAALGYSVTAHIRMVCDGERYRQFTQFVKTLDAVRECDHVTGGDALMMKVIVCSIEELENLIMKLLNYGVPTTSLVLSQTVVRHEFNLEPQKAPVAKGRWQADNGGSAKLNSGGMREERSRSAQV
jgi:Lrp/AsnC family transcriptional regulator, leucine-responsive regulatory protein